MAFLEKIGDLVKTAAIKTEELTKTLGEKTEAVLEIQSLSSKSSQEKTNINTTYKQIGELIWSKFEAGEEIPAYLQEHCTSINDSLSKIDSYKTQIDKIKSVVFKGEEPKLPCTDCDAQVPISSKFCHQCGSKMPAVEETALEPEVMPEEGIATEVDTEAEIKPEEKI